MRVVELGRFGGPEALVLTERPHPEPAADEVVIEVKAAGINFADTQIRQGQYPMLPELPTVLGMEVAGIVSATGSDVDIAIGTRVVGVPFASGQAGGYAQNVALPARHCALLPDAVAFDQAAALPMQGLTALHMLRRYPPHGKAVLVTAAAGGLGSLLVQLARLEGASTVVGAAGGRAKGDVVRNLGADDCVDYGEAEWPDLAQKSNGERGFDIVYDSVGGDVSIGAMRALAPQGTLVLYGAPNLGGLSLGPSEVGGLMFAEHSIAGFALFPTLTDENLAAGLDHLLKLVADGRLRPVISPAFPLTEAAEAHRAFEERRTWGKVVLTI